MLSSHLNSLFTCVFHFRRTVWTVLCPWGLACLHLVLVRCLGWRCPGRGRGMPAPAWFLPSWLLLVLGCLPSRLAPIWTMALWVLLLVAWFARRSRTRCIAFFFSRASFVSFSDPGTCACTRTLLHSCSLVRARSPPCLWVCLGMHTRMGVLVGACFSLLFPRSFPLFFTEGGKGGRG